MLESSFKKWQKLANIKCFMLITCGSPANWKQTSMLPFYSIKFFYIKRALLVITIYLLCDNIRQTRLNGYENSWRIEEALDD